MGLVFDGPTVRAPIAGTPQAVGRPDPVGRGSEHRNWHPRREREALNPAKVPHATHNGFKAARAPLPPGRFG
jgi:hypothetical protein